MIRSEPPSWPMRARRRRSAGTDLAARLQAVDYEEAQAALKNSIAGRIGSGLTVISAANGFDWRTNVALLSGIAAKEVIISTMGTAYSLGQSEEGKIHLLAAVWRLMCHGAR